MDTTAPCFLVEPPETVDTRQLYDDDIVQMGFVMNVSRLWAHQPESYEGLFGILAETGRTARLSLRHRGVLVVASASARRDSYCSLAWGRRLAAEVGDDVAAAVLRGSDDGLDEADRALAAWARRVAVDPGATTGDDVQGLRDAGFDDAQIFAITLFVGLRMAFSTVNDALGAVPDRELADLVPAPVRAAVSYGRPPAD